MKRFVLIGWLCIGLASGVFAQNSRPCVGLVLSGGGAKGFAHVGVLEVLDSLGIPVDMVAGTSMGAIMGGLYSIGYTPEMLKTLINETDWNKINSSEPGRLYKSFEDRQREDKFLFGILLDNGKFIIPSGLINGQKVHAKLNSLTQAYHGQQDFSTFPRSFICVATDLNSGTEFCFTRGNLPDAMRASMAIPSVYRPYLHGNKWLIDGGVVNNFPSDKLKAMGADIIIGVDVQTTFADTMSSPTVARIIEKTSMYMNYSTSRNREELCRLVIKPDMQGFQVSDFKDHELIIQKGRDAAMQSIQALQEIRKLFDSARIHPVTPYSGMPDSVYISGISVIGLKNVDRATVLQLFQIRKNTWIYPPDLEERLGYVYGSGFFDQVQYQIIRDPESQFQIEITVIENPVASQINLGFRYDNDFGVGILGNITKRNLLIKGTLASVDFLIGETPRIKMEYLHTHWGITSRMITTTYKFYLNRTFEGNVGNDNFTNTLFWRSVFKNNNSYGFGLEHNYAWLDYRNVPGLRPLAGQLSERALAQRFNHINLLAYTEGDKLNRVDYPTNGYLFYAAMRLHQQVSFKEQKTMADPFLMFYGKGKIVVPVSNALTVQPGIQTVINFWHKPSMPYSVYVGGMGQNYFNYQLPLAGFRYQELGTLKPEKQNEEAFFQANATTFSLDFQWNVWQKIFTTFTINAATLGDTPENMAFFQESYAGFGLKLGLQTVIGPVELCFHQAFSQAKPLLYFNIGFYY